MNDFKVFRCLQCGFEYDEYGLDAFLAMVVGTEAFPRVMFDFLAASLAPV